MKTLRIRVLQHVSFEGPGTIAIWAQQNNHVLSFTRLYNAETLPSHTDYDWLIVMGGPMSVGDEADYPWLKAEKQFIGEAIGQNKTVLGICLGAQLIASVLGANVYPNKKKEIGWFPVSLTDAAKSNRITTGLAPEMMVLHWHGDTFNIPEDAVHLIKTEICPNQAFVYNDKVLGLQFHFEATPDTLRLMIENCRAELVADDFIQTEQEILANSDLCTTTNSYLAMVLDNLARID